MYLVFVFNKANGEKLQDVICINFSKNEVRNYMNGKESRNLTKYRIVEVANVENKHFFHWNNIYHFIVKFLETDKLYYSDNKRLNRKLIGVFTKNLIL